MSAESLITQTETAPEVPIAELNAEHLDTLLLVTPLLAIRQSHLGQGDIRPRIERTNNLTGGHIVDLLAGLNASYSPEATTDNGSATPLHIDGLDIPPYIQVNSPIPKDIEQEKGIGKLATEITVARFALDVEQIKILEIFYNQKETETPDINPYNRFFPADAVFKFLLSKANVEPRFLQAWRATIPCGDTVLFMNGYNLGARKPEEFIDFHSTKSVLMPTDSQPQTDTKLERRAALGRVIVS